MLELLRWENLSRFAFSEITLTYENFFPGFSGGCEELDSPSCCYEELSTTWLETFFLGPLGGIFFFFLAALTFSVLVSWSPRQ